MDEGEGTMKALPWKIKISKLAVIFFGGSIVSVSCFYRVKEATKENIFSVNNYAGSPLIPALVPKDTLEAAFVALVYIAISAILGVVTQTHIGTSAIQRVAVDMVNKLFGLSAHDKPVHVFMFMLAIYDPMSSCIGLLARSMPVVLADKRIVSLVNDSDKATGKRNYSSGARLEGHWKLILSSVGHVLLTQRMAVCVV